MFFYYLLSYLIYTLIPYITTFSYIIKTLAPLFFYVPNYTDKKIEEEIKDDMKDFISKTNITKNIQFRIIKHQQFCSARGTNFFNPCIFIAPKLYEFDKNILRFIIKHELAHIKNNDCLFIPLAGLLTNICLRIFIVAIETNSFFLNLLPQIIPFLVLTFISRFQEQKADEYAIKYSNQEELESAVLFFKALDLINPYAYLIDLFHPSLAQRISNIEKNLSTHKGKKNDLQKKIKKITTIKKLIFDTISSI